MKKINKIILTLLSLFSLGQILQANVIIGDGATESLTGTAIKDLNCQSYMLKSGGTLNLSLGGRLQEVHTLTLEANASLNIGLGKILLLSKWVNNGLLTTPLQQDSLSFNNACASISIRGTSDSDYDGISDSDEGDNAVGLGLSLDVDADNIYNFLDRDSDGDGILDEDEQGDVSPRNGIPDYLEAFILNIDIVKEDIVGNADEIAATAEQINGIRGISGAREGIDYTEGLGKGRYEDNINPSIAEIQNVIDVVNASHDGLEEVKEDILGNENEKAARAEEINAIEGISRAREGVEYVISLENGTYVDIENPTLEEIQRVIDERNKEIDENSAVGDSQSGGVLNERVIVDVFANDNLELLDENSIQLTGTENIGDSLVVEGEGIWSVEDGKIVFTPEAGFVFDPTSISYTLATNTGERLASAEVEVNYKGLLRDDVKIAEVFEEILKIEVLRNDNGDLNKSSVEIVLPEGFRSLHEDAIFSKEDSGKKLFVPAEGTWSVNEDGSINYVSEEGKSLVEPTAIGYRVFDKSEGQYLVGGKIKLEKSIVADATDAEVCQTEDSVATTSNTGLLVIILLGTLFGLFFIRREG